LPLPLFFDIFSFCLMLSRLELHFRPASPPVSPASRATSIDDYFFDSFRSSLSIAAAFSLLTR